jgi:heat shock protein HslJ
VVRDAVVGPTVAALTGRSWQLVSFGATDDSEPAAPERPATLTFEDARLGGTTGCNRFNGPYQILGDTLAIGALLSTRMACPGEALARQERAIFATLRGAVTFRLTPTQLQLLADEGRQVLTYQPVAS